MPHTPETDCNNLAHSASLNLRSMPRPLAASLLAAALTALLPGSVVGETTPVEVAKPKPAAENAGLVNNWLREQSPMWSAWDLGGQLRVRYERFDGAGPAAPNADFQRSGADNLNDYFWTREKLHLGYRSDWFGGYVEGRNSNSSGDDDARNLGEDSFDLHQAFLTLGNAKEFPLTAKVGRQELAYGDERLVGRADWGNTGRTFDAAKLRFETKDFWLDTFAGRVVVPVDGEFNEPDSHDWLFGAYASSKTLVPIQESQVYVLSRNVGPGSSAGTSPRDIYSVGARVKSLPGKLKGWDYTGEFVKQYGSITQSDTRRDQDAYAMAAGGGFTWAEVWSSPRVGLEYNFSSGDSDPNDGESETLDNLFPTNHKHYGLMDLVGWRNIHDPRLSASFKPHKKISVSMDYHLFWLADTHDSFYPQGGSGRQENGYGRNSQYDSFVGSEIDLDVAYAFSSWAGLRAGYGHFFTGDYIDQSKESVGGSTDADWCYIQAVFDF